MVKRTLWVEIKEKGSRLTGLLMVILFVLLGMSILRSISKIKIAETRIAEAENKVEKLSAESERLYEHLNEVSQEQYTEKQLRDKLGLAKEGEIVIVLPEAEILRRLVPKPAEEEANLPDPNWVKWKKLFL